MHPDYIDWDDPNDPRGNVQHIAAADLTPEEVEAVLDDADGPAAPSEGAPEEVERWIIFGWTTTGRHIAVVFEILCDEPTTSNRSPPSMRLNTGKENKRWAKRERTGWRT